MSGRSMIWCQPTVAVIPRHKARNLDTTLLTAIFGGTFDPVHNGHLNLAEHILARDLAGQVVFVPARIPPHKRARDITADAHRLAMLRRAVGDASACAVSAVELERAGPSYTIDTAAHFKEVLEQPPRLVLGMDSLRDLHLWYRSRELAADYDFIIYRRPGVNPPAETELARQFGTQPAAKLTAAIVDGPLIDVSSTDIRNRLADGKSVAGLLPTPVLNYIQQHSLYRHSADNTKE